MDSLSRFPFISETTHQPVGMVSEEPPPYTELPINGHISLMTGYSPHKQLQNIHQFQANSSLLTTNDVTFMDSSNYQGNNSDDRIVHNVDSQTEREYVEDMLRGASPVHDQSYSSSCEASQLSWSFSGYQDHQTEHQRRASTPHHTTNESVFPQRRSHRSRSVDTAVLPSVQHVVNELDHSQVNDTRLALTPSPTLDADTENSTITHQITHVQEGGIHEHPTVINDSGPFLIRPVRLPPLQSNLSNEVQSNLSNEVQSNLSNEVQSNLSNEVQLNGVNSEQHKHRKKRKKRRRGHSWHGEAVSELTTQPPTLSASSNMSTVVE